MSRRELVLRELGGKVLQLSLTCPKKTICVHVCVYMLVSLSTERGDNRAVLSSENVAEYLSF